MPRKTRAKRSELIAVIRGGEGEADCEEVPNILRRADDILRAETLPERDTIPIVG